MMNVAIQREQATRWMVATHNLGRSLFNFALYGGLALLCGRGAVVVAGRQGYSPCDLADGLLCRLPPPAFTLGQALAGLLLVAPLVGLLAVRRALRGRLDARAVATRRIAFAVLIVLAAPAMLFCGAALGGLTRTWLARFGLENGIAESIGIGGLLITVVWGAQNALRRWSRDFLDEYRDFGPSVKPALTLLLLAGGVLMFVFARWAGGWQEHRPTPPVASIWALAIVGGLMLIAGWTPVFQRNLARAGGVDRVYATLVRWLGPPLYVLCGLLSAFDFLLARPIAAAAGARQRNIFMRYLILFAHMAASAAILAIWDSAWSLLGLAWAFLIAFGLARRWSWVEDDRERYRVVFDDRPGPRTQIRIGFDEDLRDEALTAFLLLLVVVLPLALMRADACFELFAEAPGPSNWWLYVGSELLKAAPFVDWSEVYGIDTSSTEPDTDRGRHAVFAMRALMDLLLIAAILQSFTISARLGRQKLEFEDPSEPNELLDPFEERALFIRIGRQDNWRDAIDAPSYKEERLHTLIERRRPSPTASAATTGSATDAVAIAAARLAGFQLSERALRELLSVGALARGGRGSAAAGSRRLGASRAPQSAREFWAQLRREAAEGLVRRRDAMGEQAIGAKRFQRTIDALAAPARMADIDDELKQIRRRREIEDLALRMTAPSPAISKDASDKFQDQANINDIDSLLDLTGSSQRRVVVAAATAIGKVASTADAAAAQIEAPRAKLCELARDVRADVAQAAVNSLGSVGGRVEGVLADVVQSAPPAVRRAAVDALGRLASDAARVELINLLHTNRRGLAARAALALRRHPHDSAAPALLAATRSRNREVAEAAFEALGGYRSEAVRNALVALARDGDDFAGPRALSALFDSGAQDLALELARGVLADSASVLLRMRAVEIVVRGQDLSATPVLLTLAQNVSAPEELRIMAIEALERIGAVAAIEPLKQLRGRAFARGHSGAEGPNAPRRVREAAREAALQLLLRQRESKRRV